MGPSASLPPFELHRPTTVTEAATLLHDLDGDAHALGGGTELLLVLRAGMMDADHLVDVKRLPGMTSIWEAADGLHIGGAVRHAAVEQRLAATQALPALATAERHLGNPRVRSTGTLGGNLCFAEPHSDPATALLAYAAGVDLLSTRGARRIAIDEFLVGAIETAREPDEILTAIVVPLVAGQRSAYARFVTAERPTAGVATVFGLADGAPVDARVAVGCIAGRPILLPETQRVMESVGQRPDAQALARLAATAAEEVDPVSDAYGPADYKRHIVGRLVTQAFTAALSLD